MAIQATFTSYHGDVFNDAYIKIENQAGIKGGYSVLAIAYVEKEGMSIQCIPYNVSYDTESERNFEEQMYDALKEQRGISDPKDI